MLSLLQSWLVFAETVRGSLAVVGVREIERPWWASVVYAMRGYFESRRMSSSGGVLRYIRRMLD